jgi:hypothetical protein
MTAPTSWLLVIPPGGAAFGLCPPIPLDATAFCCRMFLDHVTMPDGTPVEPETHLTLSAQVTVASMPASPDPNNPSSRSTAEPPAKPPVSALKSAARRDSSHQKSEKDFDTPSAVSSTTPASTPSGPDKVARQVAALVSHPVSSTMVAGAWCLLVTLGTSRR